jgi:hypothetical protein
MLDLPDRILKITSGRYFFVPFITLVTSDLHFMLSTDNKRNDTKINLKERGTKHAGYKKEKDAGITRSDDLI